MTNNSGVGRVSRHVLRVLALTVVPACLLVQSSLAQDSTNAGRAETSGSSDSDTRSYNKRDFSGLWARNPSPFKQPPCPECSDKAVSYGFLGDVPPGRQREKRSSR